MSSAELRMIEARLHALGSLEIFSGKRPEITEDIKRLTERRKKLRAEAVKAGKEDAGDQDDRGTVPADDRAASEDQ